MTNIHPLVESVLPDIIALRHDLHQHPELGYEEFRTARRVLEHLSEIPDLGLRKSEDFAFYAEQVPAMFFMLGLLPQGHQSAPLPHQPDFDFSDGALPYGIKAHVEIARNFARVWNQS
ncbi:MAG: hypothetical protein QGG64_03200 [Candidatus Latescibacteria bacterium]|nr:hypothetical protein [Candidatus Latescibacterota bacterium]